MNKVLLRVLLTATIALSGLFGFVGVASAQDEANPCQTLGNAEANDTDTGDASANQSQGDNCVNEGDSDGEVEQGGSASSGDGVAGQVAGVVSAGDASVDATNRSDDVEVDTGDATGTNNATLDTRAGIGFNAGFATEEEVPCRLNGNAEAGDDDTDATQTNGGLCLNSGDADGAIGQTADAASGDGVGGQVIGVVTSAGGSADLVLDNESSDAEVESGDGDFTNDSDAFVDAGIFFDVAP